MRRGFTLIELLIVMGIISILFGTIAINLLNAKHSTDVASIAVTLVSDMKEQQLKAMLGVSGGRSYADNYGIYFQPSSYILFHGASYSAMDTTNFTVNLDSNATFSNIAFPNSTIIFTELSGTVSGFLNGSNSVTVRSQGSNDQKTVTVNANGVVTGVN